MNLRAYKALITRWEKEYGKPTSVPISLNPTDSSIACVRCKKIKKKMARHHKGNDLYFAKLLPDVFAPRYIEFNPADIAKLCDHCHKSVHEYMKDAFFDMDAQEYIYKQLDIRGKIEWCNQWRSQFQLLFAQWIVETSPRGIKNVKRNYPSRPPIHKKKHTKRRFVGKDRNGSDAKKDT